MRVALATCRQLPEPDHDEGILRDALANLGIDSRLVAWDDPAASLNDCGLCVIRSTWNYHLDRPAFLAWAEQANRQTRLYNPLPIVGWNTEKTYLRTLAQQGVSIVPTHFVARGADDRLPDIVRTRGWRDVVIKPTVSAASFSTRRFGVQDQDAGSAFLAAMTRERAMMVQPYIDSVQSHGERALVWIDGMVTHAVRKQPRFHDGHEAVSQAVTVADDERRFAQAVLSSIKEDLLYARVDVARGKDGSLLLMELELVEPSLFLVQFPQAASLLAEGIRNRLTKTLRT